MMNGPWPVRVEPGRGLTPAAARCRRDTIHQEGGVGGFPSPEAGVAGVAAVPTTSMRPGVSPPKDLPRDWEDCTSEKLNQ